MGGSRVPALVRGTMVAWARALEAARQDIRQGHTH